MGLQKRKAARGLHRGPLGMRTLAISGAAAAAEEAESGEAGEE